jgi:hypothetical protein
LRDLAPGGSETIAVTGTAAPGTTGERANVATVNPNASVADSYLGNKPASGDSLACVLSD